MSAVREQEEGSQKKLLKLFFPLLLVTFCNYIFLLLEKLFLARFSIPGMHAVVNIAYIYQVFHGPAIALAMMAQIFVARSMGADKNHEVGPGIWQFVWFSFLSLIITIPGSILYANYFLKSTDFANIGLPYFYIMLIMNFLFPFGTALTCFFTGQGKTRLILLGTFGLQATKIILGIVLIFGSRFTPPIGIIGGALSTVIAQFSYSLVLFIVFLNKKNRNSFKTNLWKFKPKLFYFCMYPGFLRALNRILTFACWGFTAHLMTVKGGDYSLALSIGGIFMLFLPFLADALCQAQSTISAQLLGANKIALLNSSVQKAYILAIAICILVAIPLLIFPSFIFHQLFPELSLSIFTIRMVLFGVFASFFWFVITSVPLSTILAFKDMKFSLFMGAFSWVNSFLLMYFFIEKFGISADQFWLVLSITHASSATLYYFRSRWLCKNQENLILQQT